MIKKTSFSLNNHTFHLHWLLVMVLPALLYFFHSYSLRLPWSDGAHYLSVSLLQYDIFTQKGLWEGIKGLYTFRSPGDRPLLYPSFITIAMKLAGGDLYDTVKYVQVFFAALWCIYTYRLIALFADPLKAVCGAFLVVAWPSFFQSHYDMFSEPCYLSLMFAALYYLFASDFLQKKSEVVKAGIFAGLTLCVRPEILFILPIGLSYYFYQSLRREQNILTELLLSFALFVVFFVSLYASYLHLTAPGTNLIGWLAVIAAALACCYFLYVRNRTRARKEAHLFIFIALTLGLSLVWYIPYVNQLYEWFRVGYYNLQDYNNPVVDFSTNWKIIYPGWRTLFWFLFLLSAFAMISEKRARKEKADIRDMFRKYGQVAIAGAVVCVIYFLLLLLKSAGITPLRRTDPGAFTLMVGLIILSASATVPLYRKLVNGALLVMTVIMFIYSLNAFSPLWHYKPLEDYADFLARRLGVPWQPTVYDGYPRADFNLVNAVTEFVEKHRLGNANIRVPTFTDWPPDVTLGMDLAYDKLKPPYTLGLWTIFNDTWKTVKQVKSHDTQYLLIDSFPEFTDDQLKEKIGFHFYPGPELLYRLRHGDRQGMKQIGTIRVNDRIYSVYRL